MRKNYKLLVSILVLILSMILLTFASVPLYNIFCKVTGFAGTPQRAENIYNIKKGTKKIKIEFDSNVDQDLLWKFIPKHRSTIVTTGESTVIFYEATNLTNHDIIGTAIYNITPLKAGKYFVKIHCFCFEEQLIKANSTVLLPVSFYIDSEIELDKNMNLVNEMTLSYSFFKVREINK